MERKDLITILLSLPVTGKMKDVLFNDYSSASAYKLLELQGYININKKGKNGLCQANLSALGLEWVKHHMIMASKKNIVL